MAKKHSSQSSISPETQQEAAAMAKATQKQGQTKEQTKLIAQGIQKGIALYKQQQKEKARQADKLKKRSRQSTQPTAEESTEQPETLINPTQTKQSLLPWGLLLVSWAIFATFYLTK